MPGRRRGTPSTVRVREQTANETVKRVGRRRRMENPNTWFAFLNASVADDLEERGDPPELTQDEILAWADAHHTHRPVAHVAIGADPAGAGETWLAVEAALALGLRACQAARRSPVSWTSTGADTTREIRGSPSSRSSPGPMPTTSGWAGGRSRTRAIFLTAKDSTGTSWTTHCGTVWAVSAPVPQSAAFWPRRRCRPPHRPTVADRATDPGLGRRLARCGQAEWPTNTSGDIPGLEGINWASVEVTALAVAAAVSAPVPRCPGCWPRRGLVRRLDEPLTEARVTGLGLTNTTNGPAAGRESSAATALLRSGHGRGSRFGRNLDEGGYGPEKGIAQACPGGSSAVPPARRASRGAEHKRNSLP